MPKGASAALALRRTLSRTIRAKPGLARLFVLSIFIFSSLVGILIHSWWTHSQILIARAVDAHATRYTNDTLALSAQNAAEDVRGVTLVSSMYSAGYSPARIEELRLVILRNLALNAVNHYELLVESGTSLPSFLQNASATGRLSTRVLRPQQTVTYASLFALANSVTPADSVAVIANADIYFDESLSCVSLLSKRVALALSRHPSPDCVAASARGDTGWEPADFCAGYDPVRAASHDAFAFVAPISDKVMTELGELRVNEFGAENVVVYLLKKAGYKVLNPCSNVHGFHQHCDSKDRARSARQSSGSAAEKRKQFAGAEKWGFLDVKSWAGERFTGVSEGLDCLSYGLGRRQGGRPS